MLKLGVCKRTSHRSQSIQTDYNTMKKINWSPSESLAVKSDIVCSSNKMLTHEQKQFQKPDKKSRKPGKILTGSSCLLYIFYTFYILYTLAKQWQNLII